MAWSSPRTWVTNEVVTAAHMNQEVRDNLDAALPDEVTAVAWTPDMEGTGGGTWTGTTTGRRWRVGPLQFVWARFVFPDNDQVPTGNLFVTLPSTAAGITANASTGSGQALGSWQGRDSSATANNEGGTVLLATSTTVRFARPIVGHVTNTAPFAWDTNDILSFQAVYPIA